MWVLIVHLHTNSKGPIHMHSWFDEGQADTRKVVPLINWLNDKQKHAQVWQKQVELTKIYPDFIVWHLE